MAVASSNISSIASENPVPNSSLYSATKGALDTITMALAKELGPRKIRVNTVAPGRIRPQKRFPRHFPIYPRESFA
jgi:NAD(P)-dependent dehydrogenase (short-subunit alcohol dehydrogenase family)